MTFASVFFKVHLPLIGGPRKQAGWLLLSRLMGASPEAAITVITDIENLALRSLLIDYRVCSSLHCLHCLRVFSGSSRALPQGPASRPELLQTRLRKAQGLLGPEIPSWFSQWLNHPLDCDLRGATMDFPSLRGDDGVGGRAENLLLCQGVGSGGRQSVTWFFIFFSTI